MSIEQMRERVKSTRVECERVVYPFYYDFVPLWLSHRSFFTTFQSIVIAIVIIAQRLCVCVCARTNLSSLPNSQMCMHNFCCCHRFRIKFAIVIFIGFPVRNGGRMEPNIFHLHRLHKIHFWASFCGSRCVVSLPKMNTQWIGNKFIHSPREHFHRKIKCDYMAWQSTFSAVRRLIYFDSRRTRTILFTFIWR